MSKDKRNTDKFLKSTDLEYLLDFFDTEAYPIILGLIHALESDMEGAMMRIDPMEPNSEKKLLVERSKVQGCRQLVVLLEAELRKIKERLK